MPTSSLASRKSRYLKIIKDPEYGRSLEEMAQRIVRNSRVAPNEASVESYFDCELFHFFRTQFGELGFEYNPTKEKSYQTSRHILKGRADSAIASLIVEFKQPSTLSNEKSKNKAMEQIADYLIANENENNRESEGFVTDGVIGCFLRCENGEVTKEFFYDLNGQTLQRVIENIVQVKLVALNAKNLVDGLCCPADNSGIAFKLMRSLHSIVKNNKHPKTEMLFDEWQQLFNLAHDDSSQQQAIIDRKESLEDLLGEKLPDPEDQYHALFTLQTAYAIIVKCIAYKIVSLVRYKASIINFYDSMGLASEPLRMQMTDLENGSVFARYGITNLLEGDFFSWYTNRNQWNDELADTMSELFEMLSRFSDRKETSTARGSQDFFKALYEAMVPAAVRHSLGEYYTKKWLAESVVNQSLSFAYEDEWRALDPCCGSGTFLTVLIDKVLEETAEKSDEERLGNVLNRVVGIDLNPLAALTARVNYFINVSSLIHGNSALEIPVYLGDASYVPKDIVVDGVECLTYSINTMLEPIEITVPKSMVRDIVRFSRKMNDMELYIQNLDQEGVSDIFLNLCLPEELTPNIVKGISHLSQQLVELERKNWDGVWARLITNFLSTANLGKFQLIVGNPPWVDWKSLPSGYRERIKGLCISRDLFSGDRMTGGINLNICALITNVVAQNWLAREGVVGFLMPEPLVFQQSYEGFRNLKLDNGRRLYFNMFHNWNHAGHPFKPVTQKFLSYFMSEKETNYTTGVPVKCFKKNRGVCTDELEELDFDSSFSVKTKYLATCNPHKNFFSYVEHANEAREFIKIAGSSQYVGREGIEFYPQELVVFKPSANLPSTETCTALDNMQNKKSKYNVPSRTVLLETKYLHPMVKGPDIAPFHVDASKYIVPFPYDKTQPKIPIAMKQLATKAPPTCKVLS